MSLPTLLFKSVWRQSNKYNICLVLDTVSAQQSVKVETEPYSNISCNLTCNSHNTSYFGFTNIHLCRFGLWDWHPALNTDGPLAKVWYGANGGSVQVCLSCCSTLYTDGLSKNAGWAGELL